MDKHKQPFPREPWQRLLRDRGDAPPETTDARIRAAARRALGSRPARWWLPASLAASFLLAVLIVQWQFGDRELPAVLTEADVVAPTPAPDDMPIDLPLAAATAPRAERAKAEAKVRAADEEFVAAPAAEPQERTAVTGAPVGGPERDLQESSDMPVEEARERAPTATTGTGSATTPQAAVTERKPEAWYAEIEKLRAAGRMEEAERELERLEAAHPGWLERHFEELERR